MGHRLRLAAWNTARHSPGIKLDHLAHLSPDVAVLPELAWLPMAAPADADATFVDFGAPGELGIGVVAWAPWSVGRAEVPPIAGSVIGAVDVAGPVPFKLLAVWASLGDPRPKVSPVIEALDAWSGWHKGHDLVVAGDFNTGGHWGNIRSGPRSHFPIVDRLGELGLHSAYHSHRGAAQGHDEEPTHWHSRGGTYMVDHVFVPRPWRIHNVVVGAERPWRSWSDHAPVLVDVVAP